MLWLSWWWSPGVEHLHSILGALGCTNCTTVITRVMLMKETKPRLNYSRQVACQFSRDVYPLLLASLQSLSHLAKPSALLLWSLSNLLINCGPRMALPLRNNRLSSSSLLTFISQHVFFQSEMYLIILLL